MIKRIVSISLAFFILLILPSCTNKSTSISFEIFQNPVSVEQSAIFNKSINYDIDVAFSAFDAKVFDINLSEYYRWGITEKNEIILGKGSGIYLLSMVSGALKEIVDLGGECVTYFRCMNEKYLVFTHSSDSWWKDCFLHLYDMETGEDKVIYEFTYDNNHPVLLHDNTVFFDTLTGTEGMSKLYEFYSYDIETGVVTMIAADAQHPLLYDGELCWFELDPKKQVPVMVNSDGKKYLTLDNSNTIVEAGGGTIAFTSSIDYQIASQYFPDWPGLGDPIWGEQKIADSYSIMHKNQHIPLLASKTTFAEHILGRMITDGRYCIWDNPSEAPMYYDIEEEVIVRLDSLPEGRYSSLLGANGPVFVNLDTSTVYYK